MASPLISFLTGLGTRRVVETVTPARTMADVVLAPQTRATLEQALAQVRNHHLIFNRWGLGERHTSGQGLAFNFAGRPGTGKTICAEAIAHELGLKLLVVNYAEAESMWFGETPKNIVATFRAAAEQNAVLLFDEADAIAMRRSSGAGLPHERESNLTVNVLLRELEAFNGIVIFATNLAANFDPAFERRIRAHVLFEIPGPQERARIQSILYVGIILLTSPFGWIAGTLSARNKALPFMLNMALFTAGAVLAYLAGQASQKRIAAERAAV